MNYGKRNAEKRQQQFMSRGPILRKRLSVLFLGGALILVLLGIVYAGHRGYTYIRDIIDSAPEIDEIDATPTGYMSTVLDIEGNVTAELVQSGSNRVYVTLSEVPEDLQHAFVAIEDERFYEHNGIDLKGIARAGLRGISQGKLREGASTITQQLLKNNVFDSWTEEKTDKERITRKLQEQFLAVQLEKKVSKDWIMENYLNTINLGQNTLGVQSASRRYFGKNVSELTLAEGAALAGITKNPSGYNPISHPDKNRERQELVLDNMERLGYITKEEHEAALAEDIYTQIGKVNDDLMESEANITSYFVDALTESVVEDLQEKLGYSEAEAYKALYSGGLTIYSTQDPAIQKVCDKAVADKDNYDCKKKVSFSYALSIQQDDGSVENYSEQTMLTYVKKKKNRETIDYSSKKEAEKAVENYKAYLLKNGGQVIGEKITYTDQPQVSVSVIDQHTGMVKALVGGRGKKEGNRTLNRAYDMTRQPGSTFKILTAYATAFETEKGFSLSTTIKDEPVKYSSGKVVQNASGKYSGYVTVRKAIEQSINTVAVKTIQKVTPEAGYKMAQKFGITTLTENDVVEALPLGGIERGVTNVELAAAYAAIADEGIHRDPVLYTKILDHDGNVLLENESEESRVIKDTTAFRLISAMEGVIKNGTGKAANFSGMSIAGKTGTAGTSEASRDLWFVGFSPYYTCAVWAGYDDYAEMPSVNYHKIIWKNIMQKLNEGKEDTGFPEPQNITWCTICSVSGKLAVDGVCTQTYREFFEKGDEPQEECSAHVTAEICKDSGLLAGEFCPEDKIETKAFVKGSEDPELKMPESVCDVHKAPEAAGGDPAAAGTDPGQQAPAPEAAP